MDNPIFKTWQCRTCGYAYDEAVGVSDEGLAVETRWEDVPADWKCPECGGAKNGFQMGELEF